MHAIDRAITAIETFFGWFAKLALVAMMLLVCADAGGRYLFAHPVPGVYEITEFYLMVALIFLSFAMTQRVGGHVRADVFFDLFPIRVQKTLEVIYLLAALVLFALIAWAATRTSINNFEANRWTTGVVPIPTGPSWAIAALGAWVFCLRLGLQATLILRGGDIAGRGADAPEIHDV